MIPLVSILIPAFNAEEWIAETIKSALAQTWPRKEVIVIDDGSTDDTAKAVERVGGKLVTLVSIENRGLSGAVNYGLQLCRGDYVQELDADDLLAPNKIERQLAALRPGDSKRVLLSSPWAPFFYRTRHARWVRNSLWQDLTPVEWLLRKMRENLHMQNATWLMSRELVDAAGPWDTALHYDQDGEYFARVLLASKGTRFVPGTGIYYRLNGCNRISYIGKSRKKKVSLLRSMKLHMQYLRSLEDSKRVRNACLVYMQNWYAHFYPDEADLMAELQAMAQELGGELKPPRLGWKYAWMEPIAGWRAASWAQSALPQLKATCYRQCDKALLAFERRSRAVAQPANGAECVSSAVQVAKEAASPHLE